MRWVPRALSIYPVVSFARVRAARDDPIPRVRQAAKVRCVRGRLTNSLGRRSCMRLSVADAASSTRPDPTQLQAACPPRHRASCCVIILLLFFLFSFTIRPIDSSFFFLRARQAARAGCKSVGDGDWGWRRLLYSEWAVTNQRTVSKALRQVRVKVTVTGPVTI